MRGGLHGPRRARSRLAAQARSRLRLMGTGTHGFGPVVAAVACATVVEQLGDLALGSVAARLRGMTVGEIAKVSSAAFVALPVYIPMTALLVYACREVSTWSVVLFLFPAFAAQKFFLLYQKQRATSEELTAAIERQERANLSFATALVATLDARDRYTAGHSAAVAIYARDIAERLGLSESDQRLAHLAGLVHDIGKVGLPAGLLEKPGPLTADQRLQMEEHPVIGERILAQVEGYCQVAEIVRHHHERVDGAGYPDRLRGDSIPLLARILAVADAYNAMTSRRPYREAMPPSVARMRFWRKAWKRSSTPRSLQHSKRSSLARTTRTLSAFGRNSNSRFNNGRASLLWRRQPNASVRVQFQVCESGAHVNWGCSQRGATSETALSGLALSLFPKSERAAVKVPHRDQIGRSLGLHAQAPYSRQRPLSGI